MKFEYETDRLLLKIQRSSPDFAKQVLDFYSRNRTGFEPFEAARPADFYTEEYHASLLAYEYNLAIRQKCFRFWIYEKQNPDRIAGSICFYNIVRSIYERCETGYKMDKDYRCRGYASEAMAFGTALMFEQMGLHRIEAYVMENNTPSIRLLLSLGFAQEGICRKSVRIRGIWEDHLLFARIK